jgi:threonyl-tRNA synthetase
MISVIFPDDSVKKFDKGVKVIDVAKSISEGLARKVISASFNNETLELNSKLVTDGNIKLFTWEDDEGKQAFWHSSAHILAQTIKFFYPKSKLTIGPSIENGFYYDVDFGDETVSEKDFGKIESKFLEFSRNDFKFKMKSISKKRSFRIL